MLVLGSVAAASKLFMQGLTQTTVEGEAILSAAQVCHHHGSLSFHPEPRMELTESSSLSAK